MGLVERAFVRYMFRDQVPVWVRDFTRYVIRRSRSEESALGATAELEIDKIVPAAYNDPAMAALTRKLSEGIFGAENIENNPIATPEPNNHRKTNLYPLFLDVNGFILINLNIVFASDGIYQFINPFFRAWLLQIG